MIKKNLDINVYEAFQNRMEYIFQEFDNIYVSFSGGKDSGLLLNLVLDYAKKTILKKRSEYSIRTLRLNIQLRQNIY